MENLERHLLQPGGDLGLALWHCHVNAPSFGVVGGCVGFAGFIVERPGFGADDCFAGALATSALAFTLQAAWSRKVRE